MKPWSDRTPVPSGGIRAFPRALAVALVFISTVPVARAQNEPVPQDKTALERRLEQLEDEVVAAESEVAELTADLAAVTAQRVELTRELATRADEYRDADRLRSEANAVGLQVAIEAYVEGSETLDPAVAELVSPGTDTEQNVRRALFTTVRQFANERIARFETARDRAATEITELRGSLTAATEQRAELMTVLGQAERRRAALVEELRDIGAQLERIIRLGIRYSLTGVRTGRNIERPALAVKIDNAGPARPQKGLATADIIFEERVEGAITRFVALYHSRDPGIIGPIRSARTTDFDILANLGSPAFANSGGNPNVLAGIARTNLRDVGASRIAGPYFRDSARRAPHNLYARANELWAAAGPGPAPPLAFEYLLEDERPRGATTAGVEVRFGGTTGAFRWDDGQRRWLRSTDGRSHIDADTDEPVGVTNVVVQFVEYRASSADVRSPEAITVGSGVAWILTQGRLVEGRWSRSSSAAPTLYRTSGGDPIRLTPGTTWVALPERGSATIIR